MLRQDLPVVTSRFPGFYRLALADRRRRLAAERELPEGAWTTLDTGGLPLDIADGMIENVVGTYGLPFALAVNFTVDHRDVLVPMAVEEPSVVAAASNAARMARAGGGFTTTASAPVMIGQVQLVAIADVDAATRALEAARGALLEEASRLLPRLVARGGGPVDLRIRPLARSGPDGGVIVVHLHVDCRDAMGANLVNGLCEDMADRLAAIAQARPGLRILSNLTDQRTVTVRCRVPDDALASDGLAGADVRAAITAASRFAELDPYRACTHNKGIMNGVDAVLVATGQDWRAVEAGAHAYAARGAPGAAGAAGTTGYAPLAVWRDAPGGEALDGEMTMPLAVGTVDGALHVHRGARLALALADVTTARGEPSGGTQRLAAIAAAAGLATNLAALRALATDGIQRGHMSLHARVVARTAGATGELVERVADELSRLGDVKAERAREVLARLEAVEEL
jgi:hydroxymethylglutaryl-CoA reductase